MVRFLKTAGVVVTLLAGIMTVEDKLAGRPISADIVPWLTRDGNSHWPLAACLLVYASAHAAGVLVLAQGLRTQRERLAAWGFMLFLLGAIGMWAYSLGIGWKFMFTLPDAHRLESAVGYTRLELAAGMVFTGFWLAAASCALLFVVGSSAYWRVRDWRDDRFFAR